MRTKLNRHAVKRTRAAAWRALLPASALLRALQGQHIGLRRVTGTQY